MTKFIGVIAFLFLSATLFYGLYVAGPDVKQSESVRLMFVHLPSIAAAYSSFFITLIASGVYLWKGTIFWDLLAGAAAELGVLFTGLVLVTGSIWGGAAWGIFWDWDARMTSTLVLFIMYLGYLAIRRLELPAEVRSRRAAVFGMISFFNVIIVHYSVDWWRGLHQQQTFTARGSAASDIYNLTTFLGIAGFMALLGWLLLHRFRLAWLEHQASLINLEAAIEERRAEAAGLLSS